MRMALSFAYRGTGNVSPNPRVGCVIVARSADEWKTLSCGYHRSYGGFHAEIDALRRAKQPVEGCTVYVNLEPCCHTGNTPPCCDALISAGISKVVVGMEDPNPKVSGRGIGILKDAGIEVVTGVLEDECRWINRGFIRNMTMGRPWVTVKAAVSLDGDIALSNMESKWISGEPSRIRAHLMRSENDAIVVGVGTILKDDPMLTVRDVDGNSPLKIVIDKNLDTPPNARVLDDGRCVFFTGMTPDETKAAAMAQKGARIVRQVSDTGSHIPVEYILAEISAMGVNNLMVEGGSKLIDSFVSSGNVDEFSLFIAPKLLGKGLCLSENITFNSMNDVISLKQVKIRKIGDDIWLEGIPLCSPGL
jgi:diaminohydroxyphosphoribosylaminopyrimidine deaminase/5-amino-6-(5-phosphoribosylamino)uracil reductase